MCNELFYVGSTMCFCLLELGGYRMFLEYLGVVGGIVGWEMQSWMRREGEDKTEGVPVV